MPLYEYQCDACDHRFERIQKFSDAPLTECPACGGPVRKLVSSPAIQFKGSGFYITDYARSGQSSSSSSSSSEKSTKTEKSDKPAAETSSTASSSSGDAAKAPAAPASAKPTGSPGT